MKVSARVSQLGAGSVTGSSPGSVSGAKKSRKRGGRRHRNGRKAADEIHGGKRRRLLDGDFI